MAGNTFEYIVEGPAVSIRAKDKNAPRYQKWIRTVRAAAARQWPPDTLPTASVRVIVTITNFYSESPPDIDNIIKPIFDAMNGLVYQDDAQVYHVVSQKFGLLEGIPVFMRANAMIKEADAKYTEFLHVQVEWERS